MQKSRFSIGSTITRKVSNLQLFNQVTLCNPMDQVNYNGFMKRILVVGTDPETMQAILRHLKRKESCIVAASNNHNAYRIIEEAISEKKTFDLIILDLTTYLKNGIALQKWISTKFPQISIILIYGYGDLDYVLQNIRPDKDEYVQKPITPQKIMELIQLVVQKQGDRSLNNELS
jgi:DNA-binding NtrC family response regulator